MLNSLTLNLAETFQVLAPSLHSRISIILLKVHTFTMSTDYKFQGWMGLDKTADKGNMKWQEYEPKKWEETDVDIEVSQI